MLRPQDEAPDVVFAVLSILLIAATVIFTLVSVPVRAIREIADLLLREILIPTHKSLAYLKRSLRNAKAAKAARKELDGHEADARAEIAA